MSKTNQGSFKAKGIPFTQVTNIVLKDKNISLKAKGLYALIQAYITIPNFTLYKAHLISQCVEGEKAFNSAWDELKKAGYLKQYKHRNKEDAGFTYEYELLDIPQIATEALTTPKNNRKKSLKKPKATAAPTESTEVVYPQKGDVDLDPHFVHLQSVRLQSVDLQKEDINKTERNNTDYINTILSSYQYYESEKNKDRVAKDMISEEEMEYNIETLNMNIEPEIMKEKFPDKKDMIDEIFSIMCDTVNNNSEYIRIAGDMKSASSVRRGLLKLDSQHFEYILDCLSKVVKDIKNPKAYILAVLYNAHYTYNNAINFNFNRDFKGTMFVPFS